MTTRRLRALLLRLTSLFDKSRGDREFSDELESHLQLHIDDNLRAGMSPGEARRLALIELGGVESTTERYRDIRGLPVLETFVKDVSFALRLMWKHPGVTSVVVVTLAVAITVSTVIASTVDVIWHFIPVAQRDRLVFVASTNREPSLARAGVSGGVARIGVSLPDLADWAERTRTVQAFAGFTSGTANLSSTDVAIRVRTMRATVNLLPVWGVQPVVGRVFRPEEGRPGGDRVVMLSDSFWHSQFSGQSQALGRQLVLDGEAHTVIGVLPSESGAGLLKDVDLFVPMTMDPARAARDERTLLVTAVLEPGVTLEQAAADLARIALDLQQEHPTTNAQIGVVVVPLLEMLGPNIQSLLLLLILIAAFVVTIACANVSNVILARAATRRGEFAIRAALGATRFQQIRQLMVENVVSSSVAGVTGLVLTWWCLAAIRAVAGSEIPGFNEMALNRRVLAAGVAVSLLAPLAFALLPAIRTSKFTAAELKRQGRGIESAGGRRLREMLVAGQAALALILMIQVGLIVRTALTFHNVEKGFDPTQLLTLRVELPSAKYPEPQAVDEFFTQALDGIQALPGVVSAGAVTRLPIADGEQTVRFTVDGAPMLPPASRPWAARAGISPHYLQTMRIGIVRGRGLTAADFKGGPAVALINQEAVRRYWPTEDPVGKRIMLEPPAGSEWLEIVGIVDNVRNSNAGSGPTPQIYVASSRQPEHAMAIVVRTEGIDPTQLAPAIRAELARLDKDQTVYSVATMERVLFDDLGGTYLLAGMLAAIGIVALWLAAAGVYGVTSYSVSQRTREIGLRMALGADRSEVFRMMLLQGGGPVAAGLGLGMVGASALAYWTSKALDEISDRDAMTHMTVLVSLVTIALVACAVPARRAARVEPMVALRQE